MCGIAGFWSSTSLNTDFMHREIKSMTELLEHRGPDASGTWSDELNNIAFGHRRLSIVDLTDAGNQPMHSFLERYVISYNGEIYNHLEIREIINKQNSHYRWNGTSDTETILGALDVFGIERMLEMCCGMFAMAIWDKQEQKLFLARDRLGEKPLYYSKNDRGIAFASELKALRNQSLHEFKIDKYAIKNYLSRGYIDENHCIDKKTYKVPPGHIVAFDATFSTPKRISYWPWIDIEKKKFSQKSPSTNFKKESRNLEQILSTVVASHMMSDVPLGSFLSGGIDSSLITALMQENSSKPIKTFTVGFEEDAYNESKYSEKIANHLGTDHTSFILNESDALKVIPELSSIYDEPFADYSQIPTILLAREAKKHVTVALTGDGGDEIFGGYNRYSLAPKLWQISKFLPGFIKKNTSYIADSLQNKKILQSPALASIISKVGYSPQLLLKISQLSKHFSNAESFPEFFYKITSTFDDPNEILRDQSMEYSVDFFNSIFPNKKSDNLRWMMFVDSLTYLPGDILTKVDRASMSASLETRAPFLDKRIVDSVSEFNSTCLLSKGKGKIILRDILSRYVPDNLFERPKQGFTIPLDKWLRTDLKDWAEDLLLSEKIDEFGIFDSYKVKSLWNEHIEKRNNHAAKVWTILMMQSWLDNWSKRAS
ncbi:asparagine synthase (glutamine-hydrolyzing) [Gammaproteobacteria bacterium]|nr:asparagine synthase (glutamine-hydrolyzing) [Gammaproteobacteria bacterium]MDB9842370.1 asparagine synthase (glutamine-hydrolyzing) [Gammaproteobacteria bacterium]